MEHGMDSGKEGGEKSRGIMSCGGEREMGGEWQGWGEER